MRPLAAILLLGALFGCAPPPPPLTNVVAPAPGLPLIVIDPVRPGLDTRNLPSAEEAAAAAHPVKVSPSFEQSMLVRRPISSGYPQSARARHLAGHVLFRAIIAKDGTVQGLTVLDASDPVFIRTATASLQSWQYRPFVVNGKPVAVDTSVTIHFDPRDAQ